MQGVTRKQVNAAKAQQDVSNRPPPGGGGAANNLQACLCRAGSPPLVITRPVPTRQVELQQDGRLVARAATHKSEAARISTAHKDRARMAAGPDTVSRQSSGKGREDAGCSQQTSAPTVSSRDTGQGSKDNKENVSEGSSSTIVHVMRNGDAMLLMATDSMVCVK
jgi:hypothetical protein